MEQPKIAPTNKGISIKKTLNAAIDLVWEVWTNPGHIANWWGPTGFTSTIHKMEVIAGGEWRLTMHGADGKKYPNRSVFKEIILFEKIVFDHFNPNYVATIVFTSKENETLIEWTMEFETAELFETVVKVFKADEGLNQSVEKLEGYLSKLLRQSAMEDS
ncbi:polyketide cyclase [Pedobacter sp. HMF7647]|uniref:Polyketide cyclase n=1 Tax=Hufsiella arboris TaxID=2695275 RepID=A0A7K1YF19_9SPHI|nr:SRPBCC domain-containing protein [Hufsiella arboris]MXV52648.1 polyketide cyclase [Hufsiella arboris]